MTIDLDQARKALEAEQSKLIHQLDELGATEDGNLRPDFEFGEGFADAAAITSERTEVLGLVETLKNQLDDVKAAIERIDDGGYGVCALCGEEIGAARMEIRPESLLCVDCKSQRTA
jgi:RNA polymerase-binding transcription factor DksA